MTEENLTNRDSESKTQICPMRKTAQDDLEGTTGQPGPRSSIVAGSKTAKSAQKRGRGRERTKTPKTYTAAQLRKIDAMAEAQCKDTTIAVAMGFDVDTFKRDLASRTEKQRAIGKAELHRLQMKRAKAGSDTMLIWTGKQHLEQRDKAETEHGVSDGLADLLREINGSRIVPGGGNAV